MPQSPDAPKAGPALDGVRRLVVVNARRDAPPRRTDTRILILDTAWTPSPGERDDLIPVRPLVQDLVVRRNLFDESLDVLDDWAARAGVAERFTLRGVGWWSHARGFLRLVVHELLLWRGLLDAIVPDDWNGTVSVPGERRMLAEAAEAGARPGLRIDVRGGRLAGTRIVERVWKKAVTRLRWFWYAIYPPRIAINRRRAHEFEERLARARAAGTVALAPMRDESFHVIREGDRTYRGDPYVGPVIARLLDQDVEAIQAIIGLYFFSDKDYAQIRREERAIPWGYVQRRWPPRRGVTPSWPELMDRLNAIPKLPAVVDGADLGPAIHAHVSAQAWWLRSQATSMESAEGLIASLRPSVLVTGWEAARTSWLGAARRAGVPIVAIQHGVIYPRTPDYVRPPDPAHVAADLTCLFGTYERDLLVEQAGYAPDAVLATGSPRATPRSVTEPAAPGERETIRALLGVADSDRLLVVSTARHSVGDEFHCMAMVGGLFDGPLPGVHVVFKLHPEEGISDRYPSLLRGLAVAGGYARPTTSVVRDVDLYALLRSADAHLGQYSTVLTDAVLTSTPNMIAVGHAWSDVIGYVDAGVATPVSTIDDVRAFMADPRPIDPAAREAFVRRHSLDGDATGRIAEAVRGIARRPAAAGRTSTVTAEGLGGEPRAAAS
jgi:hypothetical protein